jgi:hypothetical protein
MPVQAAKAEAPLGQAEHHSQAVMSEDQLQFQGLQRYLAIIRVRHNPQGLSYSCVELIYA